jgi:hypothetical protein
MSDSQGKRAGRTKPISSVGDLITHFGDVPSTARAFNERTNVVWNWRERGSIPGGKQLPVYLELKRRRIPFLPSLFGLKKMPAGAEAR